MKPCCRRNGFVGTLALACNLEPHNSVVAPRLRFSSPMNQAMSNSETPDAHRRQGARVRSRGVAAGQGAERQDLHHPRADASRQRRDRQRLSRLHEDRARVRFPGRGADHPLPRHARPRRGRLRSDGGHRLLRGPLAPDPGGGQGARPRAAGGAGRHPRGETAPSGMAGGGGADQPARGLRAGRAARVALSVRADAAAAARRTTGWRARSSISARCSGRFRVGMR